MILCSVESNKTHWQTWSLFQFLKGHSEISIGQIGIETLGSWGQEGIKLVKAIGRKIAEVTGEKRSSAFLFQRISMAIQRGNASCVLGTVPHTGGLEEVFEFESI